MRRMCLINAEEQENAAFYGRRFFITGLTLAVCQGCYENEHKHAPNVRADSACKDLQRHLLQYP